ncbi:hypothetical protein K402DRAFT_406506 [Aulographum hederae CBS 113979]|uniref:Uncharacterized protein n=1 Tax=Aulographum hederae CBS 113979 TaxID=1176131 RepID=A0A6G1GSI6_9PEZI|nr:hypothetical protein K402DRAFT_406506 [Aulographum hederae CBS 113979]
MDPQGQIDRRSKRLADQRRSERPESAQGNSNHHPRAARDPQIYRPWNCSVQPGLSRFDIPREARVGNRTTLGRCSHTSTDWIVSPAKSLKKVLPILYRTDVGRRDPLVGDPGASGGHEELDERCQDCHRRDSSTWRTDEHGEALPYGSRWFRHAGLCVFQSDEASTQQQPYRPTPGLPRLRRHETYMASLGATRQKATAISPPGTSGHEEQNISTVVS